MTLRALALALAVAMTGVAQAAAPPGVVVVPLRPERQAREAAFMRTVKPNFSANAMTANVLAHTGEHVAYICTIEELTRPGIVVGQCGEEDEPVDLYLELPPGKWAAGERVRVLGILDRPGSWSDVSGHTIYYPFVKAVYVDRLR